MNKPAIPLKPKLPPAAPGPSPRRTLTATDKLAVQLHGALLDLAQAQGTIAQLQGELAAARAQLASASKLAQTQALASSVATEHKIPNRYRYNLAESWIEDADEAEAREALLAAEADLPKASKAELAEKLDTKIAPAPAPEDTPVS